MDILITGGAGFVGTNFIQYILEKYKDYNVICVDKLVYSSRDNFKEFEENGRFRFYQVDICNTEDILKVFKFWFSFDVVINFTIEPDIISNITAVYNLLEIIKKYKVKRFIQVSTDEVYGSLDKGKFVETTGLDPHDFYSASKASSDLIAISYFHTLGVPVIISRCSSNFGPYQHPEKFIPSMIISALESKKVYTQENYVRSWINVLDHCRALETLMHYGKPGETYNIGGGSEIRNIEIAQFILEYLGLPHDITIKTGEYDRRCSSDYAKIKNEFGWKPILNFRDSMAETIDWYKSNQEWWKVLK